jgi:hypothetical protein
MKSDASSMLAENDDELSQVDLEPSAVLQNAAECGTDGKFPFRNHKQADEILDFVAENRRRTSAIHVPSGSTS